MDKDRIKGKAKDIAGRIQRQKGEWTGNTEDQVKGASKQMEGKVQNIAGKIKDAAREADQGMHDDRPAEEEPRRKRSA